VQTQHPPLNDEPQVIQGGLSVDDRGFVSYVNEFRFERVKRFYLVSNHKPFFVRAWHGHRREWKVFVPVTGSLLVGAVKLDDWERPSKDLRVHRFVLSDANPAALVIPPGFANGFMNLTPDAKLMVFSSATLEESRGDDFRFDAFYWDPWKILER